MTQRYENCLRCQCILLTSEERYEGVCGSCLLLKPVRRLFPKGAIIRAKPRVPSALAPPEITGVVLRDGWNLLVATYLGRYHCVHEGACVLDAAVAESERPFALDMRRLLTAYDLVWPTLVRPGQWMWYSKLLGDVEIINVAQQGKQWTFYCHLTEEHYRQVRGDFRQLQRAHPGVEVDLVGPTYGCLSLTLELDTMEDVWVRKAPPSLAQGAQ